LKVCLIKNLGVVIETSFQNALRFSAVLDRFCKATLGGVQGLVSLKAILNAESVSSHLSLEQRTAGAERNLAKTQTNILKIKYVIICFIFAASACYYSEYWLSKRQKNH
jgi:hypothetical protein